MSDNHSKTGERAIPNERTGARGAMPPHENVGPSSEFGQGTPPVMDGRGRDGMHRESSSTRATPDNGMRTVTPEGIEIGQQSGHDLAERMGKPDARADISTEREWEPDHDSDD